MSLHEASADLSADMNAVARTGRIEHVGERGLVALCNPYRLDGRVSTHPVDDRGWASMNVYLLREGDHMLVIDSGLTAHRDALLEQLATLIDERTKLSLLAFRYGELNPLCNFGPIAGRFGVTRVFGNYFGPPCEWLDFLPGSPGISALAQATAAAFPTTGAIKIDPGSQRVLESFVPPIWLLPYPWAYDAATRTLFTPDMFSWVHRQTPDDRWIVSDEDDETTVDEVWASLCTNKYWWLPGAKTDGMRRGVASVFERFDVETIAAGYGCVLTGTKVIERHVQLLDGVLARAQGSESHGLAVATWRQDRVIA